jgi:hypothetical protein
MLRKIFMSVAALAVLGVVGYVGFLFVVMGPHDALGMLRYDQRHKGALAVGDPAPDATLTALDGRSPVALGGQRRAKPLVLVFGSYT